MFETWRALLINCLEIAMGSFTTEFNQDMGICRVQTTPVGFMNKQKERALLICNKVKHEVTKGIHKKINQ